MEITILEEYRAGKRDFREADLSEADLSGADLSEADLSGADLSGANLRGANLRGADLRVANLRGADLYGANLREANLRRADLYGADLSVANLSEADLPASSHDAIAEILRHEAGADLQHRRTAGSVLVSRDWCWKDFAREMKSIPDEWEWALGVLEQWDCFKDAVARARVLTTDTDTTS